MTKRKEAPPEKIDLIEIFSEFPCEIPKSGKGMIDSLCKIYGESLQPCMTDVFYKAVEQNDPYVIQLIFLMLLNEEDYMVNVVKDKMPDEKKKRLKTFFEFLDIKHKQLLSIYPTEENIQDIIETYTNTCINAWSFNRQVFMRKEVEKNTLIDKRL